MPRNPYPDNYFDGNNSDSGEPPRRLVSAPTLYCIFALGIIFVAVGTFITAHCYVNVTKEQEDAVAQKVLKYIGPILLGCGGLSLIGILLLCLVVYKTNKRRHSLSSEPIFSIGPSTFYSSRLSKNESFFGEEMGIENVTGPLEDDDPMKFLAETVVNERRRKMSKPITSLVEDYNNTYKIAGEMNVAVANGLAHQDKGNETSTMRSGKYSKSPLVTSKFPKINLPRKDEISNSNPENIDIIQDNLKRVHGFETLLQDSGLYSSRDLPNSGNISRSRSYSSTGPKPKVFTANNNSLRRHATVTTATSKTHRKDLRSRALQRQLVEHQLHQTLKKNKKLSGHSEVPEIHNLTSYSPEVIDSLIGMVDKQNFERSLSYLSTGSASNTDQLSSSALYFDNLSRSPDMNVENIQQLDLQNENYLLGSLDRKFRRKNKHTIRFVNETEYLPNETPTLEKLPRRMNMGVSSLKQSLDGITQETEWNPTRASWESSDSSSSAHMRISPESSKRSSGHSKTQRKRTKKMKSEITKIKSAKSAKSAMIQPPEFGEENRDSIISSESEENNSSACSCSSCAGREEGPPPAAEAVAAASDIMVELRENSEPEVGIDFRQNSIATHPHRHKALSIIRSSGHGSIVDSDD